jgi:hypothetical protein
MNGYIINIEKAALENEYFREVLYTAKNCQLVVMSLKPGEDMTLKTSNGLKNWWLQSKEDISRNHNTDSNQGLSEREA